MLKRYLFLIIILFLSNQLFAQDNNSENVPHIALYYELFGKFFSSANVDFPLNRSNRLGFGISPVYGDIVPTVMYYYLQGERSYFEIGGGIGYVIILTDDEHEEFKGVTFHGVIGYRYQKKNGFLFRAGFTPIVFSDKFLPWLGISLGYSF